MNDTAPASVSSRDLATLPISEAIEAYAPNFAAVLPPNIPVEHFKRMVVTAINTNPALVNADRRTLFNSCVKCASDGLLPDGREAALVIYSTKVKGQRGAQDQWIDAVQYLPMVSGIRKRLRNSGEVDSATAEVVYRNDRFKYHLGDGALIEHEPPPLDEDRGPAIGAYAIIHLASGEVIREVMGLKEIERVRAASRSKDRGPWVDWWGEMARKTVLRRAAKAAPQAATLEKLLARDEEAPELPTPEELAARPPRQYLVEHPPQQAPEAEPWRVVDHIGEVYEFQALDKAIEALRRIFMMAAADGPNTLQTAWDNNADFIADLYEEDRAKAEAMDRLCTELRQQPSSDVSPSDEGRPAAGDAKPSEGASSGQPAAGRQPLGLSVPQEADPPKPDETTAEAGSVRAPATVHDRPAAVAGVPQSPEQHDPFWDGATLRIMPPGKTGRSPLSKDWKVWPAMLGPRIRQAWTLGGVNQLWMDNEDLMEQFARDQGEAARDEMIGLFEDARMRLS